MLGLPRLVLTLAVAVGTIRPASAWAWTPIRAVAPRAFRAQDLPPRTFTWPQILHGRATFPAKVAARAQERRQGQRQSLSEMENMVKDRRGAHGLSMSASGAITAGERVPGQFDVNTAVQCAGFAFEAYNEPSPNDARWERGADGCAWACVPQKFA